MEDSPIKVFCVSCGYHLYNLEYEPEQDDPVIAKAFVPADSSIPQPKANSEMICPKCGGIFAVVQGSYVRLLTDRGLLPHTDIIEASETEEVER